MTALCEPLSRRFYLRDTLLVAGSLLGKFIVRRIGNKIIRAMIVETEAYIGDHDPASHSYGRVTERNKVMFGIGGTAYVYFIYGNHYCFNAVTGREGKGDAVLIRGAEIVEGAHIAAKFRKFPVNKYDLANGPGKLCEALCIDKSFNGHDLTRCSELFIAGGKKIPPATRIQTPRIGISKGSELNYRFIINGNPCVTKHAKNPIKEKTKA